MRIAPYSSWLKTQSLVVGSDPDIAPELYEIFFSRRKEQWKGFGETHSQ